MRILIVVSEAPPIVSGISRCIAELQHGLGARGHVVDTLSANDVPRLTLGEFRFSSFLTHLPAVARRFADYDLINVHGPIPTMSDLMLLLTAVAPASRRPRVVYTHHSAIDIQGLPRASTAYNAVHDMLARTADQVIASTRSYADLLRRPGGPPVHVVPWGVDAHRFTDDHVLARGPGEPLRVLFVGQMRPYKGVDVLLKAVAGQPSLQLTLVGGGPLLDGYRRQAASQGQHDVRFVGRVDDAQLAAIYRQHHVVVLPSTTRAEAFGLVLLEGMAGSCVPVASDLPGVRDVAAPSGLVTAPSDATALRAALVHLADDDHLRQQLGRASHARALEMSWDRVCHQYEGVFLEALVDWQDLHGQRVVVSRLGPPSTTLPDLASRFGASWASLLLFDGRDTARLRAGWGRVSLPDLHARPPLVARHVATTRQALLIDADTTTGPVRRLLRRQDVHTALSVPVQTRKDHVAVLNLSRGVDDARPYTEADLDALVSVVASRDSGRRVTTGS